MPGLAATEQTYTNDIAHTCTVILHTHIQSYIKNGAKNIL